MNIKRAFITGAIGLCSIPLMASSCTEPSKADLGQPKGDSKIEPSYFVSTVPDKLEVIVNVDLHPNIVRLCVDGLAFMTISSSHSGYATPAIQAMPVWDDWCAQ